MTNVQHFLLLLTTLVPACGWGPPGSWEWPDSGDDGSTTGEGTTGDDTSQGHTSSVDTGTSDSDSDSTGDGSSSGSSSDESTDGGTSTGPEGDSTGGEPACLLPDFDPWCLAQLEVAQAVGCGTAENPDGCYAAVSAQWGNDDPTLVQGADCDAAVPGCMEDLVACFEAEAEMVCLLLEGHGVTDCEENAAALGIDPLASAMACGAMITLFS